MPARCISAGDTLSRSHSVRTRPRRTDRLSEGSQRQKVQTICLALGPCAHFAFAAGVWSITRIEQPDSTSAMALAPF